MNETLSARELPNEQTGHVFELTNKLRWYTENYSVNAQRLQQAWVCRETGEIDWQDVPYENKK